MTQKMTSQQNVLNALGIDSFRQFPKEKVNAFISLIPSMDRELSIECIKQFPNFVELATEAITKLNGLCDTAIKEAGNNRVLPGHPPTLLITVTANSAKSDLLNMLRVSNLRKKLFRPAKREAMICTSKSPQIKISSLFSATM